MAAEDAAIGVDLIDDDVFQPPEERTPIGMEGQDAGMEHVGVGDEHAAAGADARPLPARCVAIVGVDRDGQPGGVDDGRRLCFLVVGQRLGGKEIEGTGGGVGRQPRQDGQRIGQRFAAGRGRGDDDVLAAGHGVDGRRLVAVELLDAPRPQRGRQPRIDRVGHGRIAAGPGGDALPGDDIGDEVAVGAEVVEEGG